MSGRFAKGLTAALLLAAPLLAGAHVWAAGPSGNPTMSCSYSAQTAAVAAPLPRVARQIAAGGPLRIVAIGSSSTAGAGASGPEHSYPARLADHLRQRFPGVAVTVLNKGANGEVGAEMMRRFQRDVIDEKPDLVIWQVGANTVLRGEDPDAAEVVIRTGIRRLKAAGLDVVLMDLQYAPAMLEKPRHADMQARIDRIAAEEGVGLFHRFAVMRQWVQTHQASMSDLVGPDGIHQNDFGYDCIARSLAASLQDAASVKTAAQPR
ncbi:SGNH/GDSL hydrolase family protein [Azospirillum sp. sgz302134]